MIVHVLANTHVFIRMIWNVINTRVKGVQWTYIFGTVLITQLESSEHQPPNLVETSQCVIPLVFILSFLPAPEEDDDDPPRVAEPET